MNHTPAPWEIAPAMPRCIMPKDKRHRKVADCTSDRSTADAAHIVRCVNVHYELVAALEVIALNSADILAGGPNNAAAEHLRIASCALAKVQS